MDIAITGSSGLVGTALRERLVADGHRVLRVVRRGSSSSGSSSGGSSSGGSSDAIEWDPDAGTIDRGGLEGLDAVIHLAGEGIGERRWTPEQKRRIRESRTKGTRLLAGALAELQRPPAALLSGSAIGYYGDAGARIVDESDGPGDDFLSSVVVDWESSTAAAATAGIRTVFLRTGIVLSPTGGALARQLPFFRLGLGGRVGSGRQVQSWISLDDEVGAISWLLDSDVEGPVNLTSPGAVTNAEFTKALGRALHRPTTVIPLFGPRALYGKELVDSLLLVSQHVAPRVLEAKGYEFRHRTLDAALADLLN